AAVLVLDGGRPLAAGTPGEIIAAIPGTIVALPGAPAAGAQSRSWRRDGRWRTWIPPGPAGLAIQDADAPAQRVSPDLQDAVTVAALAREAAGPPAPSRTPPHQPAPEAPSPAQSPRLPAGPSGRGPAGRRPAARPGPLAEADAVTRRFGAATAVRDVSLAIAPGEIVGLLGANGAGKTTLIRMLLGLLPATAGTVELFGAPPARDSRRRLGYVPQGLGLYDDLTVAENLSFAAAVFGAPPAEPPDALPGELQARLVGALPLGLQRRAAFAQALAHRPDLLILDEPTSGVAPLGRARLWETIRAAAEDGAGVLVTTHYMEEAGECDRLVVLAGGRVVAAGTPAEVIGTATVTVVTTSAWRAAFRRLDEQGLAVTLSGATLRIPAGPGQVRRALAGNGEPGSQVRVSTAPATLEERFFELVQAELASHAALPAHPGRKGR
ncbi:MAG TPA: ATP-binding cassette domain-containing protein, partial [Streptosporangiaceae bacterium]